VVSYAYSVQPLTVSCKASQQLTNTSTGGEQR
jgi:hypothetical protein